MRLSNLAIEVSEEEGQKIVARKNGGKVYSVAELSDGERNAFLIVADVLPDELAGGRKKLQNIALEY